MSIASRLQTRANALLTSGQVDDARRLLTAVLQAEPDNQAAWTLYRQTRPSASHQQKLLKSLKRPQAQVALPATHLPVRENIPTAAKPHRSWSPWLILALIIMFGCGLTAVYFLATTSNRFTLDRANAQYDELLIQHNALRQMHSSLEKNQQLLNEAYAQLQQDYSTAENARLQLVNEYGNLKREYDQMLAAYNGLTAQFNTLEATHNDLVAKHYQLNNEKNALRNDYDILLADYRRLSARAIVPPYIFVQGRKVHIAFVKSNNDIVRWEVEFDDLEQAIRQGYRARENPLNVFTDSVRLENNDGSYFYLRDYRTFVDPYPFRTVIPELYYAADNQDAFIREIWHIATQLTTYSAEIEDTPRYPLETLLAGGGDCEDTAILVASMLKAAPVNWDVGLIYMDSDHPTTASVVNHVIVYINTGSQEYYIETTSSWNMEPNRNVAGWYSMLEG